MKRLIFLKRNSWFSEKQSEVAFLWIFQNTVCLCLAGKENPTSIEVSPLKDGGFWGPHDNVSPTGPRVSEWFCTIEPGHCRVPKPPVFKEQIDPLDASDFYCLLKWNDSCLTWLSWKEIYWWNYIHTECWYWYSDGLSGRMTAVMIWIWWYHDVVPVHVHMYISILFIYTHDISLYLHIRACICRGPCMCTYTCVHIHLLVVL